MSSSGKCKDVIRNEQSVNIGVILLFMLNSTLYHYLVTRFLVSHMDMESYSKMALLKDLEAGEPGRGVGEAGEGYHAVPSQGLTWVQNHKTVFKGCPEAPYMAN